jgi:predicted nucleic-acid-binding Zn-ribbon protein
MMKMQECPKCGIETPHLKTKRSVVPKTFQELENIELLNSIHYECYVCGYPSPCFETVSG